MPVPSLIGNVLLTPKAVGTVRGSCDVIRQAVSQLAFQTPASVDD